MTRRAWRLVLLLSRATVRGLQALGATTTGMSLPHSTTPPDAAATADPAVPAGPPPAHPERVRPDLAPDDVERRLWAQVRWPADGSAR